MASSRRLSVVQYIGDNESACGYCHSPGDTSISTGLYCHSLTVVQYQQLVDRGWRRSGCYLYKPNMQRTCCPQYTIRLDVNKFQASKAQKRVLRKWGKYLAGGSMGNNKDVCKQGSSQAGNGTRYTSNDNRQKTSHSSPPQKNMTKAPAHSSGQDTVIAAQQPNLQHQQSSQGREELVLQQVLRQAVQDCMQSGQLVQLSNFQVKIGIPPQKLAKKLPAGTKFTSPVAQVLAGAYRKAVGGQAPPLEGIASGITAALNARFQQPDWTAAQGRWAATALNGHINFSTTTSSTDHAPISTGQTDDELKKQPTLASTSSQAQASSANTVGQSARGACIGSGVTPAGNSPVSSLAGVWSGQALSNSLAQAVADQQTVSSAVRPATFKAGDNPAAENSPTRAEGSLHAQSTSAGPDVDPKALSARDSTAKPDTAAQKDSRHSAAGSRVASSGGHSQDEQQARHFEIKMVPAGPELVNVEYPLYHNYQVVNHHDDPSKLSKKQFQRFLIDSPFAWQSPEALPPGQCPHCGMGTFHQQYWLDGKLIAVGVVDVLPGCLSSVYFFWDSDYAPLAPGKLSALKEVEWVQEAARHCPALHHYYMGFYIHSCPKMQYKADYHPSELLCPERLCWIPFDRVKPALDEQEYQVLSDLPGALEGLGPEYGLTPSMQQHWDQAKLSNKELDPDAVAQTLVFWRDATSPYSLVQFEDLADLDAPEAMCELLQGQLQECYRLAGPAAAQMAFVP